jgi:outer membrane protein
VPIYEGGEVYARTRQAKETVAQRRIEAESTRDQVRAAVISSWGQLEAARAQITAAQAQVEAAETALAGTREEARVGQRTTLDVLNAQQELLNARVNLITAQRDRVVASYSVVQSMGRLTSRNLGLNVAQYSAKQHFDQVKDLWYGVRTPDGR